MIYAYADDLWFIIKHIIGHDPAASLRQISDSEIEITEWLDASPQPTPAEVAANRLTPAYTDWRAENGGDALRTLRRLAKESLSGNQAEHALLRSALLVIVDEFNFHSQKLNALLDAIDAASNLATLKTAVGLIDNLPDRTGAQLRTAALNKLDSGDADS